MSLSYLLDEHVPHALRDALLTRNPVLSVRAIGDAGAPPRGTLDPAILEWCEANDVVFVTNNRKSMPGHLIDHLAAGRHVPGILILDTSATLAPTVDELLLIADGSFEDEYRDLLLYLPLS